MALKTAKEYALLASRHLTGRRDLQSLQWPTARARDWVRSLPEVCSEVEALVVSGSTARGRARPDSDLDIVIAFASAAPGISAPPEVDARMVAVPEIVPRVVAGDEFLGWAILFGLAIHDPGNVWANAVAALRDRVPIPSAEAAALRALRARALAIELLRAEDHDAAYEQMITMLTQEARGKLCAHRVFPASRSELPDQLEQIGETGLAFELRRALSMDPPDTAEMLEHRIAS